MLIFGGEQQDSIDVTTYGSVTVFGGVTTVDPTDGDDYIEVDGDNGSNAVLVYGNGGEDDIEVDVSGNVTIYGGSGEDTVDGTTDGSMLIYGGEGDDSIDADGRRQRHGVRRRVRGRPERRRRPHRGHERRRRADLRQRRQRHDRRRRSTTTSTATSRSIGGQGDDYVDRPPRTAMSWSTAAKATTRSTRLGRRRRHGLSAGSAPFDPADGNDSISASVDGALLIYGNGGDDTIDASADGNVTVYGGAGDDDDRRPAATPTA